MNNRILELAKQAGVKFPSETDLSPTEKKFAELIVRECATIANTAEPYRTDDLILKHFGVE